MEKTIYIPYDRVAKRPLTNLSFMANTDEEAIRTLLPTILSQYPIRDIDIRKYSIQLDENTINVVPWDVYSFPETKADNLAPLGNNIAEAVKNFNEKVQDLNNKE